MDAGNGRTAYPEPVTTPPDFLSRLAWCAGFVDGEGHFWGGLYTDKRRGKKYSRCGLSISQAGPGTDPPEVLRRFQNSLGMGRIHGPYPNRQVTPLWQWRTDGYANTQAVVALLWHFLSGPKREQARRALLANQVDLRRRAA